MQFEQGLAARLKDAREELGLTQQQVADWLAVRRPAIAEIETGARAVKSDELARLATLYGRSINWLVEGEVGPQERIRAALFRRGDTDDAVLKREAAKLARRCELLLQMEHTLGTGAARSRVPDYKDSRALADYSDSIEHGKSVAYQERARLGIGPTAPLRDPWGIVEDAGIRVFPLELGAEHAIDGIFARGHDHQACVGVNVDKWVFRQVFTVVHEYGHALLDGDLEGEACSTSAGWARARTRYANREVRANQFAAVFLVPREALLAFLGSRGLLRGTIRPAARGLTPIEIVRAQDHFGASAQMLLWRLQNENLIDAAERKRLDAELKEASSVRIARSLGYDFGAFAQPFGRARELALRAYAGGAASLGAVAEIFGETRQQMMERLRDWGIHQEFDDADALVGGAA